MLLLNINMPVQEMDIYNFYICLDLHVNSFIVLIQRFIFCKIVIFN